MKNIGNDPRSIFNGNQFSSYIIGERSKPPSDKLGGEICIATRELVCIYLYNILGMCSFQHKWASERQLYLFVLLHHVIMK